MFVFYGVWVCRINGVFGLNYLVDMGVEMCVVSYALGGVVRGGGG